MRSVVQLYPGPLYKHKPRNVLHVSGVLCWHYGGSSVPPEVTKRDYGYMVHWCRTAGPGEATLEWVIKVGTAGDLRTAGCANGVVVRRPRLFWSEVSFVIGKGIARK